MSQAEIHVIDLEFMGSPEVIASHVIPSDDGLVVVDCGPSSTLPKLIEGVTRMGFEPRDIRHVLLTHIHLDHAGAAGTLAREFGAKVYVHKNGAGHMERPEKLIESATRIYGEMMDSLWGKFEPVPTKKLHMLEGGENLKLAGLEFRAHYTPGHAVHHLAYQLEDVVFTGDVGGVHLPGSTHVVAPTPPPDIDLEAWRASLQVLRDCKASRLFIAHFGEVDDVTAHLNRLEKSINELGQLSLEALQHGEDSSGVATHIRENAIAQLRNEADNTLEMRYALATPYQMAADGLVRYWKRKHPEMLEA
jgi:glyoxylase-like metal-dependent hydrolase (beta-lactamase superfamily II)